MNIAEWKVASIELPVKSGSYLVTSKYGNERVSTIADFSVKHQAWNTSDWQTEEDAESTSIDSVVAWTELPPAYNGEIDAYNIALGYTE